MNSPVLESLLPTGPATAAAPAPRMDLYTPIHKALRHFMADTLLGVGRLDTDDPEALQATLGQLGDLLDQCAAHLDHENHFVHTAIEARRPGGSQRMAEEHRQHLAAIAALRSDAGHLQQSAPAGRPALALRLYRHLALFVADNFAHMHHEETVHNATLWALYTDAELAALHDRLLASLPPQEMAATLRWMLPALSPAERAHMGA